MTGNRDGIRRLLSALLDNAIKYTPSGGEIDVSMRTDDRLDCPAAIIEVRDSGPGIEAEHLPRVFDRFYRISADRSRKTGGAGLGLSIAQYLASLHGGEIVVESSPPSGSTFRVILPLQPVDTKASKTQSAAIPTHHRAWK